MDPEAPPPDPPRYRPLVPLGANREEILEAVVQGWLTPVGEGLDIDDLMEAPGTLVGVHLYDENSKQTIDLGELLRRMEERLGFATGAGLNVRPDLAIRLSRCQMELCNCVKMVIRARFVASITHFGENASFSGTTFGDGAGFDLSTFGDGARFDGAKFGNNARFDRAKFGNNARFRKATFGDGAGFQLATFGDRARFVWTTFGNEAGFGGATFSDQARFNGATFCDKANLYMATFGFDANFSKATFGDRCRFFQAKFGDGTRFDAAKFGNTASFSEAKFGYRGRFSHAKFGNNARFDAATFDEGTRFNGAKVGNNARFDRAKFGDGARFDGATFGNTASFSEAKFGNTAEFERAEFGNEARFDGATLGDGRSIDFNKLRYGSRETKRWAWLRWFDWGVVRALGTLQILTRVSYSSLVLVPVLAGVWRVLSAAVGRPLLPFSWVLTFFAAVAVALGYTLYQVAAPQLIREKSRDDLISERLAEFSEDRPDCNDQLLRALDSLREVGRRLSYERHPNFVRRHGRVVWLPSELEILTQPPPPKKPKETSPEVPAKPSPDFRPDGGLMRTVIDEGARARYDLDAHDQMGWAWIAGGLYGCGIALIALILLIQSVAILATATGWSPRYLWTGIGFWTGVGFLTLLSALGIWVLVRLGSLKTAQPEQSP
jgi:hypothetical protein